MNASDKPNHSGNRYKLVKVFLTIAAVTVFTLQPIASSHAIGPGPDPMNALARRYRLGWRQRENL